MAGTTSTQLSRHVSNSVIQFVFLHQLPGGQGLQKRMLEAKAF